MDGNLLSKKIRENEFKTFSADKYGRLHAALGKISSNHHQDEMFGVSKGVFTHIRPGSSGFQFSQQHSSFLLDSRVHSSAVVVTCFTPN